MTLPETPQRLTAEKIAAIRDDATGALLDTADRERQQAADPAPRLTATDPIYAKARKLIEALAEECQDAQGDHAWGHCRHCLAAAELDTPQSRVLMLSIIGALDREREQAEENARLKDAIANHLTVARVSFSDTPYRRSLDTLRDIVAPEGAE